MRRPAGPEAPIGVFDSGLGGLSVLRELVRRLPSEDFIYVADSGYCPYGDKTTKAIIRRSRAITDFLVGQGVKLIVVACNTATVAAVEFLRTHYPMPFVGMEPAVKPAVTATRSGIVGVLATGVTANGARLQRLINEYAQGIQIIVQPCPGLVAQVEAGALDTAQTRELLQRYTAPLLAAGADTLVLGCTHYPFLKPLLKQVIGPDIALIDTGAAVSRRCAEVLAQARLGNGADKSGIVRFYGSGDLANTTSVGGRLWGSPITVAGLPVSSNI